ncbi:UNVERIFIED_CONTAM: hypothetical protein K2H54_000537 [Gekko kuhli]
MKGNTVVMSLMSTVTSSFLKMAKKSLTEAHGLGSRHEQTFFLMYVWEWGKGLLIFSSSCKEFYSDYIYILPFFHHGTQGCVHRISKFSHPCIDQTLSIK